MKYLKRYYESTETSFNKEDLEFIFAHSFDVADDHGIDEVYFNPNDLEEWAHNDFSNPDSSSHPVTCITGYEVSFHHEFYDESSLEDFEKYSNLIAEIKSDIERFKGMYNVGGIFFFIHDSILRLIIRP